MVEPPQKGRSSFFVRNATGLVRDLSAVGVFAWVVVNFPWLSSWAGIFWVTPSWYHNVNYYASLGVWAVIAIVIVLLYWQLTVLMPRSGGDYVFVSRSLLPPLGFLAGFLFFVAYTSSAGSGPYWAFAEAGSHLSFSGNVLGDPAMANLGASITPFFSNSNKILMFGIGLALLASGGTATLVGGRVFKAVVYAIFAYGVVTLLVVVGIYLAFSHSTFVTDYNLRAASFTNSTTNIFTQAAKDSGYTPGTSLANLSAVIPLLFVSIGPYPVMQVVGGEIQNPKRTLLYGLIGAEILSIGIWFGLTALLDKVVNISFIEAWTLAPSAGAGSAPVPTIFATVLVPNAALTWFIFVGLFLSNIGWGWLAFVFLSRMLMAWSFDRLVPAKFAHVSSRFHTPTFAVVFCVLVAIVPMYLEFFTSFIATQVNAIFILASVWFLAAVSAIVLPFRRKDLYENAPGKVSIGGVPLVSVLGLAGVVVFGYLAYYAVTNSAIGPFATGAQEFLAAIFTAPLVIFTISYVYNKRKRGIDLSLLFREVPPE
jgi:APA family basic amino acid/polyamine antiporter